MLNGRVRMAGKKINISDYQNEFSLNDDEKKHVFAEFMECSKKLITDVACLTECLICSEGFSERDEGDMKGFFGNIASRHCGRYLKYKKLYIWIGLHFNNIPFSPDYRLMLFVHAPKEKNDNSPSLDKAFLTYRHFYDFCLDEQWVAIALDNYFISCCLQIKNAFVEEIKAKLDSFSAS